MGGEAPAKSPLAELLCGICQDDLLTDCGAELGELDSCNHRFCFPCITKWAEIENTCPFCKQRFARLRRKKLPPRGALLGVDASGELPGLYLEAQDVEQRNQRVVFEDPQFQQWIEQVTCLACGGAQDEDQLLLCDGCDRAAHTYCVGLREIPSGEWFCSHCERRRAARQRTRRRPQAPARPAAAGRRRRRGAEDAVVDLASSEEEWDSGAEERAAARRAPQRRRTGSGGSVASGRGVRAAPAADGWRQAVRSGGSGQQEAAAADLSDFIVPDEGDEDSDWLADDSPGQAARPAGRARGRGTATARAGGARRGQRGARQRRQQAGSEDSGESTHERFGDSEPEADSSDSEESGEKVDESDEEGDEQPLLARLQRRGRTAGGSRRGASASAATGTRGSGCRAGSRGGGGTAAAGRAASGQAAGTRGRRRAVEEEEAAPTAAHRTVNALAANWEGLRSGGTTFGQLRRSASAGSDRSMPAAQPQRRRLVRAGALGGPAGTGRASAAAAGSGADVVDLLDSPSPAVARSRHARGTAGAAGTAVEDEQLAWEAMEAAMLGGSPGGNEQEQRQRSGNALRTRQQVVASPPGGREEEEESDLEVPLAVRLTRQIAAARQRGAQFMPRQRGSQQPQAQQAPPSTGGRTVRDMRLMAAAARGGGATPGSGARPSSGSRPSPLIPRLRGFDEAAAPASRAVGNASAHTAGGRGSASAQQQQQQQQQRDGPNGGNPFTRFQCASGGPSNSGGPGSIGQAPSVRRESREPARQEGSPRPLQRRDSSPKPLRRASSHQPLERSGAAVSGRDFSFASVPVQHRPAEEGYQQQGVGAAAHHQLPHAGHPEQGRPVQHTWQQGPRDAPAWQHLQQAPQQAGWGQGQPQHTQPAPHHMPPWAQPQASPQPPQQQQQHAPYSGHGWQQPASHSRPPMPQQQFSPWPPSPGLPPGMAGPAGSTPGGTHVTPPMPWAGAPSAASPANFSFHSARDSLPAATPRQQQTAAAASGASPMPSPWQQQQLQQHREQSAPAPTPRLPAPPQLHEHGQQQGQAAAVPLSAAAQQPPVQQQERQRVHGGGGQARLLTKHDIVKRLKPLLKQRMEQNLLPRESYRLANKAATTRLYEAQQQPGWAGLCDGQVEEAVQEAVQQVASGVLV